MVKVLKKERDKAKNKVKFRNNLQSPTEFHNVFKFKNIPSTFYYAFRLKPWIHVWLGFRPSRHEIIL